MTSTDPVITSASPRPSTFARTPRARTASKWFPLHRDVRDCRDEYGDVDLVNVAGGAIRFTRDRNIGSLAVGASTTYSCTVAAETARPSDVVTVTGEDKNGNPVYDDDDSSVEVINPDIAIQKTPGRIRPCRAAATSPLPSSSRTPAT